MSSNHLMYDTCAYKKRLDQSTGPLSYILYPGKYNHCAKCRIELGSVGGNGVSLYTGNLVDLENDLRGQTRPASSCPDKKYTPRCKTCRNCTEGLPCGCVECQEKLAHQPSCQMVRYPPVPMPNPVQIASCGMPQQQQQSNQNFGRMLRNMPGNSRQYSQY